MDVELKPCPFCGHKATLSNDGLTMIDKYNRPSNSRAEVKTQWKVTCDYCGCGKHLSYSSRYVFQNDGTLKLVDGTDGRLDAIEYWNTRWEGEKNG